MLRIGVPLTILVDGSFATRRYCPEYVDVLCLYERSAVRNRTDKEERIIKCCAPSYTKKDYCFVRVEPINKGVNLFETAQRYFGLGLSNKADIFKIVT